MSLRGDGPIEELAVPSGTTVEEHDLVVDGDVLVGGQSTVEFGLRGRNVAIGERVSVGNDIEAEGDCRLDTWCTVDGNVLVGEDAYLGERVTVTGRLMVSGDLDIGDDVSIEEGFEANGWIVIRNPVPTIVFYFIVLSQLLRVGETDAADELAEALADGDDVRDPLLIPRGADISDDAWRVSTPATVGDDCRIHGNLRAESVRVGERNEVFGSLRAREGITVGAETVIHGDVTTRGGTVTIEAGARVLGDVSAGDLVVHDGAEIDGSLRARGEMKLVQETGSAAGEDGQDEGETETAEETEDADDEAVGEEGAAETESATDARATEGNDGDEEAEVEAEPDADSAAEDASENEPMVDDDQGEGPESDDEPEATGEPESDDEPEADDEPEDRTPEAGDDGSEAEEASAEVPPVRDAEAVAAKGSTDDGESDPASDKSESDPASDKSESDPASDKSESDTESGTAETAVDPDAEAT